MTRALCTAAAVAAFALAVAGCGSEKYGAGGGSGGKTATIAGVLANDHGSKQVSGKSEVQLDDFYFDATVLTGKPGAKVALQLTNNGKAKHNFTIDAQKISADLELGESETVTVTIPQSGEISFYCEYHKSMGMAGALAASS